MKKIIAIIFALSMGICAWTQGRAPVLLGAGFVAPFAWETSEYEGDDITAKLNGAGFDIVLGVLPQKSNWGIIDNFSFSWPQNISAEYKGKKYTVGKDDYKTLFLFEATVAADYFFVNKDAFLFGAGPLFSMTTFSWSTEYLSSANFAVGLGGNIIGIFRSTLDNFAVFFGTNVTFDFFGSTSVNTSTTKNSSSGTTSDWIITPFMGISIII
ncbi:MAG: hypothetical protein IJ558_04740 [Treponema sp.]|nr:hypothetical protein [Treponema sp.]